MAFKGVLNWFLNTPLREAVGRDNDTGWHSVGGEGEARSLPVLTQHRMQEQAMHMWRMHPLGKAFIEIPVHFLTAGGIRVSCQDKDIAEILESFWGDPVNDMELSLPRKIREMAIYGEQCWPAFVAPDGMVRLGYLDPAKIKKVHTDPDNAAMIIGVETKHDHKAGQSLKYKVIVNGSEDIFTQRTQKLREEFSDGECFFFRVNGISNSPRGQSDLLPVLDGLTRYQQGMDCESERWKHLRTYFWDVTLNGGQEDQVVAKAKSLKAPLPGAVHVHNEKEEWSAVVPSFNSSDTSGQARLLRNHMLAALGIPEHWLGGGGDVNRATAAEMDSPAMKALRSRQGEWTAILRTVLRWQIFKRFEVLNQKGAAQIAFNKLKESPIRIEWPEMLSKDTSKYAAALSQIVITAATAINRKLLSRETAVRMIAHSAAQFGLEIDPEEELGAATDDADAQDMRDFYKTADKPLSKTGVDSEPAT